MYLQANAIRGSKSNRRRQIESEIWIWSSILVWFEIQQQIQVDDPNFDLNSIIF